MTAKRSLRSQRLWLGKPLFETLALASSRRYVNNTNTAADRRDYSVPAVKKKWSVMVLQDSTGSPKLSYDFSKRGEPLSDVR